jgi:hypothetical protein
MPTVASNITSMEDYFNSMFVKYFAENLQEQGRFDRESPAGKQIDLQINL